MSNYKSGSGFEGCRKTEDGECGDDMGFLVSINGDTTPAQLIVGTGGTTVSSSGGTTTISGPSGTVFNMTAPQMFVSPVTQTGGTLQLVYSGKGVIIPGDGSGTMQDDRTNPATGASVTTGYTATNDTGETTEMGITSSTNAGIHGAKRSYISALGNNNTGIDVQAGSGAGKTIKLITNTSVRGTVDDAGYNGAIGQTTPATNSSTDITLTVTPLSITNGGTSARTLPQAFDNLAPTNGNKGNLIVWNGANNVNFAGSAANDTQVLTHDSATSTGVKWANVTAPSNTSTAFQASTSVSTSIADSTDTKVVWDTVVLDTNSGWNATTNQYTIPNNGDYNVAATLVYSDTFAPYDNIILLYKNTSTLLLKGEIYHSGISGKGTSTINSVFQFFAGDTVQVNTLQNSGGALTLQGDLTLTNFSVTAIGGIVPNPPNISVGLAVSGGGGAAPATVLAVVPASTPVTSTGTLVINYSGTPLPIANGGTNATSKPLCFDNLAPTTTAGDLIYYNSNNLRLPIGVNSSILTVVGGLPTWASTSPSAGSINYFNGTTYVSVGIGSSGQVLSVVAGIPTWVTNPSVNNSWFWNTNNNFNNSFGSSSGTPPQLSSVAVPSWQQELTYGYSNGTMYIYCNMSFTQAVTGSPRSSNDTVFTGLTGYWLLPLNPFGASNPTRFAVRRSDLMSQPPFFQTVTAGTMGMSYAVTEGTNYSINDMTTIFTGTPSFFNYDGFNLGINFSGSQSNSTSISSVGFGQSSGETSFFQPRYKSLEGVMINGMTNTIWNGSSGNYVTTTPIGLPINFPTLGSTTPFATPRILSRTLTNSAISTIAGANLFIPTPTNLYNVSNTYNANTNPLPPRSYTTSPTFLGTQRTDVYLTRFFINFTIEIQVTDNGF